MNVIKDLNLRIMDVEIGSLAMMVPCTVVRFLEGNEFSHLRKRKRKRKGKILQYQEKKRKLGDLIYLLSLSKE